MVPIYSKASAAACHIPNLWALLLQDHHTYGDHISSVHTNQKKKSNLEEQMFSFWTSNKTLQ